MKETHGKRLTTLEADVEYLILESFDQQGMRLQYQDSFWKRLAWLLFGLEPEKATIEDDFEGE